MFQPSLKAWRFAFLVLTAGLHAPGVKAAPLNYVLDQRYATIRFITSGLVSTQGYFRRFKGNLALDFKNPRSSMIDIIVDDAAIAMPWSDGAAILRSPAYFNSSEFPEITFRSVSIKPESPEHFEILGALTIRGITRTQVMEAVLSGPVRESQAPASADFVVTGNLHRSDFGMVADRSMISDVIALTIHARIELQPAATSRKSCYRIRTNE